MREVTVSIVSHNHGQLVKSLICQLAKCSKHIARVIVTHNVSGDSCLPQDDFLFEITHIHNDSPKGFGANHNQAFSGCSTEYFCVMNPDISFKGDPFSALLDCCLTDQSIAIIAPLIVNLCGTIEDSARYFPTPWGLVKKVFGGKDGAYPIRNGQNLEFPDWVAGMFMLVQSEKYAELSGFDESFFLYYEDVDFCARAWQKKYALALCQEVRVTHDARRSSHKEFKFLRWHIKSAVRFFIKHFGRFPNKKI